MYSKQKSLCFTKNTKNPHKQSNKMIISNIQSDTDSKSAHSHSFPSGQTLHILAGTSDSFI